MHRDFHSAAKNAVSAAVDKCNGLPVLSGPQMREIFRSSMPVECKNNTAFYRIWLSHKRRAIVSMMSDFKKNNQVYPLRRRTRIVRSSANA